MATNSAVRSAAAGGATGDGDMARRGDEKWSVVGLEAEGEGNRRREAAHADSRGGATADADGGQDSRANPRAGV